MRGFGITSVILAAATVAASPATLAQDTSFAQLERGRYGVITGNCQACHTARGEEPFAGARPMETPFGVIYTPNITFERETGLGQWTREDFWQAMHNGRSRDGSQLYPAFPYPHFTRMPREEVDAIYDYLSTLPQVKKEKPENDLPFPLNIRLAVKGWNMLFFDPGPFEPDPGKSEAWNRGAYLVHGPGHCAGCHSEKNLLGADKESGDLRGGRLEHWSAPNIRGGENGGLADWSHEDIVEFLQTGRNRHSAAFSSMAEVIAYSTQHMCEKDLQAIALYLKSLDDEPRDQPDAPDEAVMTAGQSIYADNCSACHTSDGSGVPRFFAPLAGSGKVRNPDATTVIRVILEGARSVPTNARPTPLSMPAFGWKLDDSQIAAVATYIRNSWDNASGAISAGDVEALRQQLAE
ncbi:c-type cytochrome [Oceanibaculum pacificum]|uniref:Alcohol dehydrogenase n=1 Tax=Oceanibaculum pacificum TaxID=580166 RepID=A0A154WER1_9PROT|nr:c-type cytochrome [Oceanibaculum pacificum]KZD11979.1 alcohol dehydrogenase [Oceanibaculum pacificum]